MIVQVIVREAKQELVPPGASTSPCPVHGLLVQANAGIEQVDGKERLKADEEEEELKAMKAEEEEELEMTECSEEIITYQPVDKNKFRLSKVNRSIIFNGTLQKWPSLIFGVFPF